MCTLVYLNLASTLLTARWWIISCEDHILDHSYATRPWAQETVQQTVCRRQHTPIMSSPSMQLHLALMVIVTLFSTRSRFIPHSHPRPFSQFSLVLHLWGRLLIEVGTVVLEPYPVDSKAYADHKGGRDDDDQDDH